MTQIQCNFFLMTVSSTIIKLTKNEPFVPGFPPSTQISPEFSLRLPTIHDKRVVFPHPEAPNNPYL